MSPTRTIGSYPRQPENRPPSTTLSAGVEDVISGLWKKLLNLDQIALDDDFFDLGGDSLIGLQMFSAIKEIYGIEFGLSLLFEAPTIRVLAKYVQQVRVADETRSNQRSLVVPLQPLGSRPALFWIPGGLGTSVLEFKRISLLLGEDQPVYGFEVEAPGQDEELESIQERARRLIAALRSIQPQGPYQLIGFCAGGLVAFEMAQQLTASGQEIRFLGIVDCAESHHLDTLKVRAQFKIERAVCRTKQFLGRGPIGCVRQLSYRLIGISKSLLSTAIRLKRLLMAEPNHSVPETTADLMEKKALRCAEHYYPSTYDGGCVVFIGIHTYHYAGLSSSSDPRLIWCRLSKGNSEVRRVPGDHLTMLKAPHVYELATQLKPFLNS